MSSSVQGLHGLKKLLLFLFAVAVIMLVIFAGQRQDLFYNITLPYNGQWAAGFYSTNHNQTIHSYDDPVDPRTLRPTPHPTTTSKPTARPTTTSKPTPPPTTTHKPTASPTAASKPKATPLPTRTATATPTKSLQSISKVERRNRKYERVIPNQPNSFMYIIGQNALNVKSIYQIPRPSNPKCEHEDKVFVVGLPKTGASTVSEILTQLGYGCFSKKYDPKPCEFYRLSSYFGDPLFPLLVGADDISWPFHVYNFYNSLITSSWRSLQASDLPWCLLYPIFNGLYPNSKYILTVRSSTFEWMNSKMSMRAYDKRTGENITYTYKNWPSFSEELHAQWDQIYMLMARRYEKHNENVVQYFKAHNISQNLLIINLDDVAKEVSPWKEIAQFLGCDWEQYKNRSLPVHDADAEAPNQPDFFPKKYSFDWRHVKDDFYPPKYQKLFGLLSANMTDEKWTQLKAIYDPYCFPPSHPMPGDTRWKDCVLRKGDRYKTFNYSI